MPNYIEYQKSIAKEFTAIKNRVRHFIGEAHWGEDGRYKEILLMNHLRTVLPSNVSEVLVLLYITMVSKAHKLI